MLIFLTCIPKDESQKSILGKSWVQTINFYTLKCKSFVKLTPKLPSQIGKVKPRQGSCRGFEGSINN